MKSSHRGFTLIEIMVAISIVAILATIGIIAYTQAQKVGRDAKRKQDMRALQVALELYYQKNSGFPSFSTGVLSFNDPNWPILFGSTPQDYINQIPTDPLNGSSGGGKTYVYGYRSDGSYYEMCINLENNNDKDKNLSDLDLCQIRGTNFQG